MTHSSGPFVATGNSYLVSRFRIVVMLGLFFC